MDDKSLENISIPSCAQGLRIFVVDPDTSSLMHISIILEKHSYKVTTIELANIALSLIREKENQYDLVIAEVDMPEMDGFTFLKHILCERDIPIILMSHKANLEMAKRGLEEGACFFWTKPLRVKDLINVWQHIFRNKVEARLQKVNKRKLTFQEQESFTENNKRNSCEVKMKDKRKEEDEICINNLEQKERLIWTPQLHLKFQKAVDILGGETKAKPNKLLKLMNVPNLTNRHVASHLQKYRFRVKRNANTSTTIEKTYNYKLEKEMNFPLANCNIPSIASEAQANIEWSSYYDIDTSSSNMIKNNEEDHSITTKYPNEDTFIGQSNSRTTSSCGLGGGGVVNFQEGNYYSQGLEGQDHEFSKGHIENQNNFVEHFEHVPNLEVNNDIVDDLSSLGRFSMSVNEIMKILEED